MRSVPQKKALRHRPASGHRHARRLLKFVCGWDFWRFVLAALGLVWEIVKRK